MGASEGRNLHLGLAPEPGDQYKEHGRRPDPRANKRILLVDDDADLRESLAEALEEAGYTVDRAGNGQEALQKLRSHTGPDRPVAVLLDLLMPVMNGWQFCQLKRRDPAVADIPVIAMSGGGQPRSPSRPITSRSRTSWPSRWSSRTCCTSCRRWRRARGRCWWGDGDGQPGTTERWRRRPAARPATTRARSASGATRWWSGSAWAAWPRRSGRGPTGRAAISAS